MRGLGWKREVERTWEGAKGRGLCLVSVRVRGLRGPSYPGLVEHVSQLLGRSHQEKCAAYGHHVAEGVENSKQLQ